MPKRLSEIDLTEVSLVDKGAVGRKFLIVKNQDAEAQSMEDVTIDKEDTTKALSDKQQDAIKKALKALEGVREELPKNLQAAVQTLANAVGYGTPEYGYAYPQGYDYAYPQKAEGGTGDDPEGPTATDGSPSVSTGNPPATTDNRTMVDLEQVKTYVRERVPQIMEEMNG